LKRETFITPSKSILDEMPAPTIVICDRHGDLKMNSEMVASFAPMYTTNHNGTAALPTYSKGNCTSFSNITLPTSKTETMYFVENPGICMSVNESLVTLIFPGQELFVTWLHPERDLQFYEQVAPWTNYRVTTKITTRISTDVQKCQTVDNDFDSLIEVYQLYKECLMQKLDEVNKTADIFGSLSIRALFEAYQVSCIKPH